MDIQTWTFILVGITFALYIGIAIWARAGSTSEFYVAGGGVHPVTAWLPLPTGCQRLPSSRWQASSLLSAMTAPFT